MRIETKRLLITEFDMSMAETVHKNSLDEDNRRFVPDEVFETVEEAAETIEFLMSCYESGEGPLVYPVLLKSGENIGYVQFVPIEVEGNEDIKYEIGYHIAKGYTGNGYAAEAVQAFLPHMCKEKGVSKVFGICLAENIASVHVLKKSGFSTEFKGVGQYQGEAREIVRSIYTN